MNQKILTQKTTTRNVDFVVDLMTDNRLTKRAPMHQQLRGHKMAVFANDHIGSLINIFGVYEKDELDVLFDFLAPLREVFAAGVALDIGANIGNHSLYFSRLFSEVHAFEPNPATFYLLKFNVSWRKNVIAHDIGLGDVPGTFRMVENVTNMGGSAIGIDETGRECVDVTVERLDDFIPGDRDLCFIKMDVEGFEPKVIAGAQKTIQERMPLIVLEQHERDFVDGTTPSIALLSRAGYKFCWHQSGVRSRNAIVRRFFNVKELFVGRTHRVLTDEHVPTGTYSMLIAVPPRFQQTLGI